MELQNQSHNSVVEALLRVMHEFLLFKAKQQEQLQEQQLQQTQEQPGGAQAIDKEKASSVSMFYVQGAAGGFESKAAGTLGDTMQSDSIQKR